MVSLSGVARAAPFAAPSATIPVCMPSVGSMRARAVPGVCSVSQLGQAVVSKLSQERRAPGCFP
jgi:hypothetical protein